MDAPLAHKHGVGAKIARQEAKQMRIQRPLVVLKNQAVRYRKLEVTQGRVRMTVDENSIHFEPSPNPNDPPFFIIYDRSGDGGTAGMFFFTEYTRPSGRKVFVF